LGALVAISVALLILFTWLHLVLALQIAATNRQLLTQAGELDRLVRDNGAVLVEIAQAQTPQKLQERALQMGFRPQEPVYLLLPEDASRGAGEAGTGAGMESGVRPIQAESDAADWAVLEIVFGDLKPNGPTNAAP
jgi:hypothetical protein